MLEKIQRAKDHLQTLEHEVHSFLATKPYTVSTKRNPTTQQLIYYLAAVTKTPIKLSLITGDVIHNLRSALDHVAYRLVLRGTGQTPSTHIYFPIFDDQVRYTKESPQKTKGMDTAAKRAIDALQPYKGGNNALWQIHKLDNIDKHRMLLTVGSAFRSVNLSPHMEQVWREGMRKFPSFQEVPGLQFPDLFVRPADRLFPLAVNDELLILASDSQPNPNIEFRFDVAFGEAGVVDDGEPLGETLGLMIKEVERIIVGLHSFLS